MRKHLQAAIVVLLAGVVACGGLEVRSPPDVPVVASTAAPGVDALVAEFFGAGVSAGRFEPRLREALLKYPTSGALHEVAGYWALLQANDHAAWENFLMAAADLHNEGAALAIIELGRMNPTRSESRVAAETLAQVASESQDAEVRARADFARAAYLRTLGRTEDVKKALAELGFVRQVALLGAFDNEDGKGLAEAYPPEAKVDLSAEVAGSLVPIRWRAVEASPRHDTIALHDLVYPNQNAVAYAAFWAQVPAATLAMLRVSTDAPVAIWVNHASVAREDAIHHWDLDNVAATVPLAAGWNEVLVKSAVKTGSWNLAVRVTDDEGRAIAGLTTSATPRAVVPGSTSSVRAAPKAHQADARLAFAAARRRVQAGHYASGLADFERLLAKHETNEVVRYFTADAAEHDHQLERALDLLSAGITEHEGLPGLLEARAALYMQKDLLSQAQRDLARVIELQPEARRARMEVAEVLAKRFWHADRVAVLTEVTRRWPDSAWGFTSLAAAYEAQGYAQQAEDAYRDALALDPASLVALRALRRILEAREATGDLADIFLRLAEMAPTEVQDQLARADFARTHGHPEDAVARLRALAAQSPDHPTSYLRQGLIAEEVADVPRAIAEYQRAQERDPQDSWLAQRLDYLRPSSEDVLRPYAASDEDIERAVRKPSAKGDNAIHVETLLSDTATLLNQDGSVRSVFTQVLRGLTQRGRDELVHLSLGGAGTVRVMKAYAEAPDGKRQDASSIEKSSVRFRNLEVGSTVVLQYASYPKRSGPLSEDYFHDTPFASLARHIDRMRWVVVAPKGKALQVDADSRIKHEVSERGSWVVHELVREDVAAIPAELSMVPVADLQAHAVVTTVPSWDSYIRWQKAILDASFPADPAIDALAAKLTVGATTPREKLAKLFEYVAQEIRYQQEYENVLAGWQPHRSSVVLERKYGDCKDKATLLIALARSVGVEVHFAVLATHAHGHPDHKVVLPWFNHAIAYVPTQTGIDEPFFLDATVDALDLWNLREDDQGAAGLVMNPKSGAWTWVDIPYQPPSFQAHTWKLEIDIASVNKVTGKSHLQLRGSQASVLRTLLRNEDQSRQVNDLIVSGLFPGAHVISSSAPDHESSVHPLAIDQELDLSGTVRREGEHFRLKLPNEGDNEQTKLSDRQTPLDLGAPRLSQSEVVIHFAKDVRLTEMPSDVEVVDPCFTIRRRVMRSGAMLTLKDESQRTCTRVEAVDYPRYRAAMERARSLLDAAVVFDEHGKASGPTTR